MASPLSSDHQPPAPPINSHVSAVSLNTTAPSFFPNNPFLRYHHYLSHAPPVNYFLPPLPRSIFMPYPFWYTNPNPSNQFEYMHALSPNPSQEVSYSPPIINRTNVSRRRKNKPRRRRRSSPTINHGDYITTVMLRNIPSRYTREMMIDFLDNHCQKANENENNEDFISAYDFFYLPMDFKTGLNRGYAFVNFTKPEAVWKFRLACNNQPWVHFYSRKILRIDTAKIQGKYKLIKQLEEMKFPAKDYCAVFFIPARSAPTNAVQTVMVGRYFARV